MPIKGRYRITGSGKSSWLVIRQVYIIMPQSRVSWQLMCVLYNEVHETSPILQVGRLVFISVSSKWQLFKEFVKKRLPCVYLVRVHAHLLLAVVSLSSIVLHQSVIIVFLVYIHTLFICVCVCVCVCTSVCACVSPPHPYRVPPLRAISSTGGKWAVLAKIMLRIRSHI